MSTKAERDGVAELLFREFGEYVTALSTHGETWQEVWGSKVWPSRTELWWLYGRFLLAREAAAIAGVQLDDEEITRQYEERLALRDMFPGGMPRLIDG
ncbi:hypothetical protein ACWDZ4_20075 [Streptomyces sp. NPDC003016]